MRKVIIGMLMAATAATPVLAQDNEGWRGRHRDGGEQRSEQTTEQRAERAQERQQVREQRQEQRQESSGRQQAYQQRQSEAQAQAQVDSQIRAQQQVAEQRRGGGGTWNRGGADGQVRTQAYDGGGRNRGGDNGQREALRQQIEQSRRSNEQVRAGMPERYQRGAIRNEQRYESQLRDQYRRDGNRDGNRDGYRGDRNGSRDYDRGSYRGDRSSRNHDWNRNWRSDNRYDWQRYRYQNRNVFRGGNYYSPYRNYSYNRLNIGFVLDELFFGRNYWISDPWQYRLPPAPYGTQWVRYFDDVVLVDVYTGEVVDVIYDFFW